MRTDPVLVDQAGLTADHDAAPHEYLSIVRLTPPGSAAAIAIGINLTHSPAEPGSAQGMRRVIADIEQLVRTSSVGGST